SSAPAPPPLLPPSLHDALPISLLAVGERRASLTGPDEGVEREARHALRVALREQRRLERARRDAVQQQFPVICFLENEFGGRRQDRKSTRLNSSHVSISYAVFC